jgi:hypothetical protein
MEFSVLRSKKHPNLILKINHWINYDFLDDFSEQNWVDYGRKVTGVAAVDCTMTNSCDAYGLIRNRIRSIVNNIKGARYQVANSHNYDKSYYEKFLEENAHFELDKPSKQREFWSRLDKETVVETYFVDIMNLSLRLVKTVSPIAEAPKKISLIA